MNTKGKVTLSDIDDCLQIIKNELYIALENNQTIDIQFSRGEKTTSRPQDTYETFEPSGAVSISILIGPKNS